MMTAGEARACAAMAAAGTFAAAIHGKPTNAAALQNRTAPHFPPNTTRALLPRGTAGGGGSHSPHGLALSLGLLCVGRVAH